MPAPPRILMCPPTHFSVDYVINPWMEGNLHSTDASRARSQWMALQQILSELAHVDLIQPGAGLPDMPFTANAGLVVGDVFVPSRFRHQQRRGEEELFAAWFREQGFTLRELSADIYFEGAGDALLDRRQPRLWLGHGHRSDASAALEIAAMFDLETIALRLRDPRFYHLDTCFCPLSDGWLLYYPPAFDTEALAEIDSRVPESKRIAVSDQDALAFACNAVNIDKTIVLNSASDPLQVALRDAGLRVVQTPMDEFLKAGGSTKCLTLRLDER